MSKKLNVILDENFEGNLVEGMLIIMVISKVDVMKLSDNK